MTEKKNNYQAEFAARLKAVRLRSGMSAKQFAEQVLQMDRGQYRNTEAGSMYLSVDKMLRLTAHTHINLHWLLTGDGDMYAHYNDKGLNAALQLAVQDWLHQLHHPTPADTRQATHILNLLKKEKKG